MTTLTESKIKRHIKSVETAILTGQDLKTLGLSLSLADGKGLVLKRRGTGSWLWLYRFRINGKENNQSFGIYPEVSLDEAREKLKEARKAVEAGDSPVLVRKEKIRKKQEEATNTFRAVAQRWHQDWAAGKGINPDHALRTWTRIEKDVLPEIGHLPIHLITLRHLAPMLKKIEARASVMAEKMWIACGQIFRHACASGILDNNPLANIKKGDLLHLKQVEEHRAHLTLKDLPGLLRSIDLHESKIARLGLQLVALTFVRHGELRSAEWTDIDFENALWTIPAAKMKQVQGGATDHYVPLSRQALKVLEELKTINGRSKFLFPSTKGEGKVMSDGTLNKALRAMGYHGRQTVHGFRSIASTLLHEHGYMY